MRRWLRLALAAGWLVVAPAAASAQIAVINAYNAENEAASATGTIPSVDASGANLLVAAFSWRDSGVTITGVTHNGNALTAVAAKIENTQGSSCQLWYMVSPSGSADVVASFSGSYGNVQMGAITASGVDTGSPLLGSNTAISGAGSTTPSVNVSSAANGLVVDCVATRSGTPTFAAGGGQTEYYEHLTDFSAGGAGSYEAGSATVTMSWTLGSSQPWAIMGAAFTAAAGGGGAAPRMLLLGVGF